MLKQNRSFELPNFEKTNDKDALIENDPISDKNEEEINNDIEDDKIEDEIDEIELDLYESYLDLEGKSGKISSLNTEGIKEEKEDK